MLHAGRSNLTNRNFLFYVFIGILLSLLQSIPTNKTACRIKINYLVVFITWQLTITQLMKYLYPAAVFVFFIFFVSCDGESDSKEQLQAPSVSPLTTSPSLPANTDSAAAFKAGVTLNPQHGQPGHRCDIAVGAPLNAPATNIQPNVTTTPPASSATTNTNIGVPKVLPQANTSSTALNPKHGEPGHRCDIAVGAPLNSKPTQ